MLDQPAYRGTGARWFRAVGSLSHRRRCAKRARATGEQKRHVTLSEKAIDGRTGRGWDIHGQGRLKRQRDGVADRARHLSRFATERGNSSRLARHSAEHKDRRWQAMSTRVQVPMKPVAVPASTLSRVPFGSLQRKCPCGAVGSRGDECEECKRKMGRLQRAALSGAVPNDTPPLVQGDPPFRGEIPAPSPRVSADLLFGRWQKMNSA